MKKTGLLIACLVLAGVLAAAGVLYNNLSEGVENGGLAAVPQQTAPATQPTEEITAPVPTEPEETQPTEEESHKAPDFTMLNREGQEVTLAEFYGKPIILNFWASWCGPCKMEMPDIQKFYEEYGEEIHFLIVNCTDGGRETVETAEAFLQEEGYTFPVYFDTTSMGAYFYGANSIPMTWFIDAEGNLQAYHMGAMSESILQQGVDLICTPVETE